MDDTWVIQQRVNKQEFLEHINSIDPAIKFTVEGIQGNESIPFLDTLVTPEVYASLSFTVYTNPLIQTSTYSGIATIILSAKYSVIGTLTHRAKTVCTKPELLQKELLHLGEALVKCKYPHWAINRVQINLLRTTGGNNDNNNIKAGNNSASTVVNQNTIGNNALQDHNRQPENTIGNNASQDHNNSITNTKETTPTIPKPKVEYVVVPYTKGLSASFKTYVVSMGYKLTSRVITPSSKHS